MKLKFSEQILKNTQRSNFMQLCPVGAELFNGDGQMDGQTGQTEMTKIIVAFRNFAKAPKNIIEFAHDDHIN